MICQQCTTPDDCRWQERPDGSVGAYCRIALRIVFAEANARAAAEFEKSPFIKALRKMQTRR